jgi:UvrD-like helicase C-terminal domain
MRPDGHVARGPVAGPAPGRARHANRRQSPGGGGAECTVVQTAAVPRKEQGTATTSTAEIQRRNYRSTHAILGAANGVIGRAAERFTKNLWTDRASGPKPQLVSVRDDADQARFIVERVLENREAGALLKQQAVLFRTSSHSGPLEIELTRRNIPFVKLGGLKFLDAAHI